MEENNLIILSEKTWHSKLIKWCWEINPKKFKNLCPYFWIVILSLFGFIPIYIYRLFKRDPQKTKDLSFEEKVSLLTKYQIYYIYLTNKNKEWNLRSKLSQEPEFKDILFYPNTSEMWLSEIKKQFSYNKHDITKFETDFYKKSNQILKRIKLKEESDYEKKKRLTRIGNILSNLFEYCSIIIIGIIIYFISFMLSIFLGDIILQINYTDLLIGLGFLSIMILVIAFFVESVFYLDKLYNKKTKSGFEKFLLIVSLYTLFRNLLIFLIDLIIDFFSIFVVYIKSSYRDFCPGIEWKK